MNDHLVIVRTGASVLDLNTYNCQELGLAKSLVDKGLKTSIIMAGHNNHKEDFTTSNGGVVSVYYLKVKSLDMRFAVLSQLNKTLSELKPTIIQIHDMGIYLSWKVSVWAKHHHIPCFLIQGVYQPTPKFILKQIDQFVTWLFGRSILRNAKGVGCKSYCAEKYVKNIFNRDTKIVHIGLDESKFKVYETVNWKDKLHLEGKKVLLYVGKLEDRRQPSFLLSVVEKLPEDYVLLIVGKGPLEQQTAKEILTRNLSEKVLMLGRRDQTELPSIYAAADLFLLASKYEIYGMVLLECMYFGVPAISSNSGGAEVIISHNSDGIVLSDYNSSYWATEIQRICSDSEQLSSYKERAKSKIKKSFLWHETADTFLNLYGLNK